MNRTSSAQTIVVVFSLFCVATLHAELSQFDKWRLEDAKREWHNERHQGFDFRVQQNDYKIRDAIRRGEEGDPFWENDFDRLMEERQRTRRNLEAIEKANDAWERERRRGSNNLTDPLDHRIRNTLNGAEYDNNGFWKDDFNRQMRQRREIRRDSEFRSTPLHSPILDVPSPNLDNPFDNDWIIQGY